MVGDMNSNTVIFIFPTYRTVRKSHCKVWKSFHFGLYFIPEPVVIREFSRDSLLCCLIHKTYRKNTCLMIHVYFVAMDARKLWSCMNYWLTNLFVVKCGWSCVRGLVDAQFSPENNWCYSIQSRMVCRTSSKSRPRFWFCSPLMLFLFSSKAAKESPLSKGCMSS